jgi:hypothetical protein
MKRKLFLLLLAVAALVAATALFFKVDPRQKIVRDAYIYGYPLVTMDMTRRQQTNVAAADDAHAPMGQIVKLRAYPAVDNKGTAAPYADTGHQEHQVAAKRIRRC